MTVRPTDSEPAENPSGYFVMLPPEAKREQIDISQIGRTLWDGKYIIGAAALFFALVAAVHAYLIATPLYSSQGIYTVRVSGANSGGGIGGQLGGLASLAGINIHGQNPARVEFVAALRSREMVDKVIQSKNLLPLLYSDKYDFAAKQWKDPARAPSLEEGVIYFQKICTIADDDLSSLITVQCEWKDRALATEWVNDLVNVTNRELREAALAETQRNLSYLSDQAQRTQVESLRESIVHLMETNLDQAMLANAQSDYAFKLIDPPRVPDQDKFVSPQRRLEMLAGLIGGAFLAMIFVLWRGRSRQPAAGK